MGRIFDRDTLCQMRQTWRDSRQRVVFTNGCFDILHPGHVYLLERARALGDVLVVGLNTDASVQRLKGPCRPFFRQEERSALITALECVDAAVLFDEETPRALIAALLPDVLVKGADWSHFIAGREEVEAAGGAVQTIALQPGFSTTDLAAHVSERFASLPEFYA